MTAMTDFPTVEFADPSGEAVMVSIGLSGLVEVQGVVSGLVADALPAGAITPQHILTYGFALIHEVGELMDELAWKPWKPRGAINRERVADEFADVLAFLGLITIYVCRLTGLEPIDLARAYLRKSQVNINRFTGLVDEYRHMVGPQGDNG